MSDESVQEVVAVFHDENEMEAALATLESAGIHRDAIALLAGCNAVQAKLGHRFRSVGDLEDNAEVPRLAYVPTGEEHEVQHTVIGALAYVAVSFGLILASSAGLAQMLLAATAAGGTVASVGEALSWLVGHHHAQRMEEQLKCGGLLVWVRTADERQAQFVTRVLAERGGTEVHIRPASRHEIIPAAQPS